MRRFSCPPLEVEVELTEEREHHISRQHPDLLPAHLDEVARALSLPDEVRTDPFDDASIILLRWTATIRAGRFVVVDCLPVKAASVGTAMKNHMTVKYDPVSDTLYIDAREPYEGQESDEIAAGVVARTNPSTGEVENL